MLLFQSLTSFLGEREAGLSWLSVVMLAQGMQWAVDALTAYSGAFGVGAVFGTHLSSSQPCLCHCDGAGPSQGLLDVLQGQLDRCTASGLGPPAQQPPAVWCWLAAGLLVGLIVGTFLGVYLTLLILRRLEVKQAGPRSLPDRAASVAAGVEATGTPPSSRPDVVTPSTVRSHG